MSVTKIHFILLLVLVLVLIIVNTSCFICSQKYPVHVHRQKLKQLAARFHRICLDNNISYFIIGGTLLGACREMDIIMHDDDIDVAMNSEDFDKLMNMEHTFNIKSGYTCYKFKDPALPGVFIDIFTVYSDNGNVYYKNPKAQRTWPRFRIPESSVIEPVTYQLGTYVENETIQQLYMLGPLNGTEFCREFFGSNWQTPICTHLHLESFAFLSYLRLSSYYDIFQITAIIILLCLGISLYVNYRKLIK